MQRQGGGEPNSADEDWDTVTPTADPQRPTQLPLYQFQSFQLNSPQPAPTMSFQFNETMQVSHPSDSTDCDIDPDSLIQQFNCLGTTDKDVLVSQLQKFIGPNLNKDAAQFFLDMNDWNLQRAIGSYFDLSDDQALYGDNGGVGLRNYSMSLVQGSNVNVNVTPNFKFAVGWKVLNDGAQAWPPGTHFKLINNLNFPASAEKVFLVSQSGIAAGTITDVVLDLTSPPSPGTYSASYQLTTPEGNSIGNVINLLINVIHDETMDLSQQFQNLRWNGGNEGETSTPNVEMS